MTDSANAKAHAREAIDRLPDDASWDDVMYELYVRESIDAGLADVAAGRTIPHDQVKAHIRELYAQLDGFPAGHVQFHMRKRLSANS